MAEDMKLEDDIKTMVESDGYKEMMKHISEKFFSYNEDYFTMKLFEMGTASQHISEGYVKLASEA